VKRFQLAVKDFALPVPRSGSIESHSGYGILSQSAEEAHRRVQKARSEANPLYRTEVRVSHSFERDGYVFVVSGRMDGVVDSKPAHIEEIKTAFDARELYEKLKVQPDHPYCLQVKTYAYMWSIQNATVPSCSIYIASYADSDSASSSIGAPRQLSFTGDVTGQFELPILLQVDAYERWLDLRLNELVAEARQYEDDQQRRMQIAAGLQFPFSKARMGQMDLVDKIERVLLSGDALLVQAPTGMGKTAAVVYPMLKEALGRGDRLVYVTPKNSQHRVAEDALERLQSTIAANNRAPDDTDTPELRYLTLSAKSKVCFKGEPVCNPEHCEFARDYYGKVHTNNLVDLAAQESAMDAEVFMLLGKQFEVCPFELSVDAIKRADVVIGDYNYVFSPVSLLGRLTTSAFGTYSKPNLIIDEAHNLPARACDYFSPRLSSQSLDACNECFESLPLDVRMQARGIVRECFALLASFQPKGREKQCVVRPEKASFAKLNQALGSMLNQYLLVRKEPKPGDPFINLCREWSDFTDAVEYEGEEFFCTFLVDSYGLSLRITCCDPSQHLASCLKEFEHTVAFSATMKPFDYYRQLCGFAEDKTESVEFSSPFPRENRKLIVIPQVSTRYSDRAQNYDKIAEAITRIINVHKGNYFVFFPSFAFLREVFDRTQLPGFDVVQQRQNMTSAEVHKLVDSLHEQKTPTVIFAVQGGVFSEGIDYMGDSLIGALIVGPALPGFDLEREKMREYYERRFGQGFDYAYTYPAMARVIQAAGRVIRSETDRGIVVLLDKRFVSPAYTSTMPADWFQNSVGELVSKSILADIKDFWGMEH
jgi:DNA excision repair protein ERCC-2